MRVYHSREIAKIMNISRQTVCTWVKKIGLELPLSFKELEEFQINYKTLKIRKNYS